MLGGMAYGQSATEGGRGLPTAAPSVSPWEQKWEKRTVPSLCRGTELAPFPTLHQPSSSTPKCNSNRSSMISFMTIFPAMPQVLVGFSRWLSCAPMEGDGDFQQHLDQLGLRVSLVQRWVSPFVFSQLKREGSFRFNSCSGVTEDSHFLSIPGSIFLDFSFGDPLLPVEEKKSHILYQEREIPAKGIVDCQ